MNNLSLISEITDNINSLNEKIDTTDKNSAKAFAYLYSVVTDIQQKIETDSKNEDVGNISKKLIEIDLTNSDLVKKMNNLETNYSYTSTELTTQVNNVIETKDSLLLTINHLETKVNELYKIIDTYDKVSADYIFVEKAKIKSSFFERLKYAFSFLFKKKKFEEEINRVETKTKEINEEKIRLKREAEEREKQLEEEKKKKSRDKIKNILGN